MLAIMDFCLECLVRKGTNARIGTLNTFEHKDIEKSFCKVKLEGLEQNIFWGSA